MKIEDELVELVALTVGQGEKVLHTERGDRSDRRVEPALYHQFLANCRLAVAKLGSFGAVWASTIPTRFEGYASDAHQAYGTMLSLQGALMSGRLKTIQELAGAEILSDLLEQTEVLISKKYFLAAAVILRAILEERLRKLCEANKCMPSQAKPSIEHYKQVLYLAQIIDKVVQKKIHWMAGVGNAAAHNLREFQETDVPTLYASTMDFLARFSS